MYTKVSKLEKMYNMRSHKAESIVALIDKYLPKAYTAKVLARCAEKDINVSEQVIRDVKLFRTKNIQVLNVILEFARENRKEHQELDKMAEN